MLYIVFTTGRCNLSCKYCGGSFPPERVPWSVKYDPSLLKELVEQDPHAVVAFYGGEPLLNPDFIVWVMDNVRAEHFVIQTNGLLVKQLPPKYWRRMDTVLLSIDGVEEVTDYYRGRGVYRRVLEAARWLRSIGFRGDLVARMALSERGDVYRDVTHLLSLGFFDHVHWQLDAVWSDRWVDFDSWLERSYLPGISRLVELWASSLSEGRCLGIAPILGIVRVELAGPLSFPPCGAGRDSVAILTNGEIRACPIAVYEDWALIGKLGKVKLEDIRNAVPIGEPCTSCDIYRYCGGRCLYAYKERLWGEEGFKKLCRATRYLVEEVLSRMDLVEEVIERGLVNPSELIYPDYPNTVEVIP